MTKRAWILTLLVSSAASAQTTAQTVFVTQLLAEQSRTAFTLQGTGARAVGSGGAFIAVADDATAVSYNPAGLAQLLKPEFSLVGENLRRDQRLLGFRYDESGDPITYEDASIRDSRRTPLFFSAGVPFKRSGLNAAVQFSYQRIIDLNFDGSSRVRSTPGTGSASFVHQDSLQEGGVDLWSLSLATEISSRFLAGISLNHWRGNWTFNSTSVFNEGLSTQVDVHLSQANEIRGWNYTLGLIWRSDPLRVGLVYRAPFKAEYAMSNRALFDRTTGSDVDLPDVQVDARLRWPQSLGWGFAFHPAERLTLMGDHIRTRWSRASLEAPGTPFDRTNFFDLEVVTRTPDTRDRRAGLEWIAFVGEKVVVPLRAGAFEEAQPMVDRRSGQQRVFRGWTAGLGIKSGFLTLDLAFKRSRASREVNRILGIYASGQDFFPIFAHGREDLKEDRVYLSLVAQLGREKVHKLLRNFFLGN